MGSESIERKRKRDQEETEKMAEGKSVKLLGFWSSAYSIRVDLALNAKGIPYEYQDEDLRNKSELLLKTNPIHKKVPVLIHNGIPVAESLIVLEYIDDTWPQSPKFVPEDPLLKAKIRFWSHFVHFQLFESMLPIALTAGEAQEKALETFYGNLKTIEDGTKDLFEDGKPLIDENNLNLLDIIIWSVLGPHKSFEEALDLKLLDPKKYPFLYSWVGAINGLKAAKKAIPDHNTMVTHLKHFRQMALQRSGPS
ncbi:hypothetical protein M9H77_04979 [Catharanthus roseus]|uniref:Uncharacterized protein n=1 Tax=Catharanthus roseus TaxID=4058 RepID=A0ACC0CFL9_CATRO|nr:hypothetical protein M9H77_04979 [Catharanthus roseus]